MSDRLAQIHQAALAAFHRDGYHATTLRKIASHVGIQAPSLYYHINSKQELLFQIMVAIMHDLTGQVRDAVAPVRGNAEARLTTALTTFIQYNTRHPSEASVSDTCFPALEGENRDAVVALRDEFDAIFEKLILEGVEGGIFSIPDMGIAKVTMLSACARVYFWYRPDGGLTDDEVAHRVCAYLIDGLKHPAQLLTSKER